MFHFVKPYRWRLVFFVFTAVGYGAMTAVSMWVLRDFLAVILKRRDWSGFWQVTLLMALVWLFRVYFIMRRHVAEGYLAHVAVRDATNRVIAHTLRQPLAFYDRWRSGDLMSRISHDALALNQTVRIFTAFVREPLSATALIGVMLALSWELTLVGVVGFPPAAVFVTFLSKRIREASRRAREVAADRADAMVQTFGGMRVVKGFGREDLETRSFTGKNSSIFGHTMRFVRTDANMRGVLEIVGGIGIVGGLIVGYFMVRHGRIRVEDFVAFLFALSALYGPTKALGRANAQVQQALPGAERLFRLMDNGQPLPLAANPVELGAPREAIRLEGVCFDYGREKVLDGVSMESPAGKVTAIVGPSGSGKSTVLNLVARFYDPVEGTASVDGVDLREADPKSWLDHIGLVTQEPFLFNSPIRDNIRYGELDATNEEIEAAARIANIHDEIVALPEGYRTPAGERGAQLSGGQRQRICLARALVRNPSVLLLDEATSSLDSASERIVQEAIDRAQSGRTSLVVAHRLSTTMDADRIYVMVGGKVEASGTHAELLERSPTYRRLWTIQQGGEDRAASDHPVDAQ
jgi:subfamily B ATP-binding cassette protein MsbA